MTTPLVSIVVVGFDMDRELPRTIQSLLPPYQRDLDASQIEIIVADNGSHRPVQREDFPADIDLTILRVDDGGISPCRAVNRAASLARGELIAVMIDGARMASPGLLKVAIDASRTDPGAFVATVGLHLGPKVQQISTGEGYTRAVEDALLDGIAWPADGYRLFEISTLGESYRHGALASPPETTFFLMNRCRFLKLGGFDEGFQALGGGFANYDMFDRASADPTAPIILLVGEATFHQLHFGATTQEGGIRRAAPEGEGSLWDAYQRDYIRVRGVAYSHRPRQPLLYGAITHPAVQDLFFPR